MCVHDDNFAIKDRLKNKVPHCERERSRYQESRFSFLWANEILSDRRKWIENFLLQVQEKPSIGSRYFFEDAANYIRAPESESDIEANPL